MIVELALPGSQDGHSDAVVGHRGHVGLGVRGPVDLDGVGPRGDLEVPADTPAATAVGRPVQPELTTDRRVQAVGGCQVARLEIAAAHAGRVLLDIADVALDDSDSGGCGSVVQGFRQHGAPHPASGAAREAGLHAPGPVKVGDAAKRLAVRVDSDGVEVPQRVRHQPFPAGLVNGTGAAFHHGDLKSCAGGVDGRGQPRGSGAGDQKIVHESLANAEFSTDTRVLSRAALRVVNASAVTHAEWTSGSASPSTATAT